MPSTLALDVLAARVRDALPPDASASVVEKRMFGGVGFMHDGNLLCCATRRGGLLLRVGVNNLDAALALPCAEQFINGTRPMTGYVLVAADGVYDDSALERALALALSFVGTLPAKNEKAKSGKPKNGKTAGRP